MEILTRSRWDGKLLKASYETGTGVMRVAVGAVLKGNSYFS
jgi:hypothetical protein